MITIKSFVFNPFMENTYVVSDETNETIIIDPGCYEKHEKAELEKFIADQDLKVVKLVNTHCHIDHVLGNQFIKDLYKVSLTIHKTEEEVLRSVLAYAPVYGFPVYETSEPNHFIEEGEMINFGNSELGILFVPGHSPGHIALINIAENICISGDVLFRDSIGRTDLPGGNYDTLIESIQKQLFPLPDDCVVYSGHGSTTTIGEEKLTNPFCKIMTTSN